MHSTHIRHPFTPLHVSRPAATLWEGASLPINKTKHDSMGLSHSDIHYLLTLALTRIQLEGGSIIDVHISITVIRI